MIAAGAGLFLTTNVAVYGTLLYSDASTDTGSSLNFVNGTTIGDEIQLTGAATLNSFAFEITARMVLSVPALTAMFKWTFL